MFWKLIAKESSDCSFAVGLAPQKVFYANKVVLGANSAVFFRMLYGELKENCDEPIDLPDVDPVAFEFFLEFCYTREIYHVNNPNWCIGEKSFQCMSPDLCLFCQKRRTFLDNFAKICYLNEKYLNAELSAYCVACIDSNFRYLPHELIVSIYVGACLIRSKELMTKIEGKIKSEVKTFVRRLDINDLQIDDFVHLVLVLGEHHYASRKSRSMESYFFPDLFAAIDIYAMCNCSAAGGMRRESLQMAFLRMVHDARLTKDDFILGPAKSSLLNDDVAAQVLERFHSTADDSDANRTSFFD